MTYRNIETLRQLVPKEELQRYKSEVPSNATPLWEFWGLFVDHYERIDRSEFTVRGVRDALRFFLRNLRIFTIEECLDSNYLEEKLHEMKKERGWSGTTFNTYRKNANTFFRWLEKKRYIEKNTIMNIDKCKEKQNEQLVLNEEQIRAVLGQIRQRRQTKLERRRNDFFVGLLVVTGARPCELLQLQCRDILEMKNGSCKIVIRGRKQKGRKRYYIMPSWLRDSYEMYVLVRQDLGRDELNLFVSSSKRTGWTYKGLVALFKRLSKELGFPVNAYGVRRFVATKLNSEGKSLEQIGDYLGHTRRSTTKRYIERSCALTKDCTDVLDDLFGDS